MSKVVRLADIGKQLNVSAVTVSKALSGQKGVSDEMRQSIIELADQMGYVRPGSSASKSYTIGVVAAERYLIEGQTFYWQLYQEISKGSIKKKCFAILEEISYEAEERRELPKIISEGKVDGMIIMGAFQPEYADFLIHNVQVPLLNLDTTNGSESCDCVVSDNMLGGYRMTNYLFELGHKDIGFVGTRLTTNSIDDRYFGYLKSLMEHGIPWREDWIIKDRDRKYGRVDYYTGFVLPEEMPTAFFCNCDYSAQLLIRKLNKEGYLVPGDISVVGFDNYLVDHFEDVGITTYEINTREMAKRAVHIMTHKLDNCGYSTGMFVLPGSFVERESARAVGEPVPFI